MTALSAPRGSMPGASGSEPQAPHYRVTGSALGLAILVLGGMQLLSTLDGTVVVVAMPEIQSDLQLSGSGRTWVIAAYALAFGGLMLLGGRLGDTFGRKRMFIGGVAIFTLASLLCGLAWNEASLIAGRVVQGASAAIAVPTAMALVATTFAPGKTRNQAFAIFAAMTGMGSVAGLIAGGFLGSIDWRLVFLINVPLGIAVVVGAFIALEESEDAVRHSLDVKGALLATLGCTTVAYAFITGPEGWTRPDVIGCAIVSVVCGVAFLVVERTADNPILPFSLFHNVSRVATMIAILFCGALMMCLALYVSLALQGILNYSALKTGLALVPFAVGLGIAAAIASKLCLLIQPRWLVIFGGAIVLAGCLYVPTLVDDLDASYFPGIGVPVFLIGMGVGFAVIPLTLSVVAGVEITEIGPLTAIAQMGQSLGGVVGLAIVNMMVTSRILSRGGSTNADGDVSENSVAILTDGYTLAFQLCAVIGLMAGAVVIFNRFTPQQVAEGQAAQEAVNAGTGGIELDAIAARAQRAELEDELEAAQTPRQRRKAG